MAEQEHLDILNRGVEVWNRWRHEGPRGYAKLPLVNLSMADLNKARLSEADLSGANLSGANLKKAELVKANLSGANLSGAYLGEVNLSGANLSGANLGERADLEGASLRGANLAGACLDGARLSHADLIEACLSRADLREAYLRNAYLSGANLSGANLIEANLSEAHLYGANLSSANLKGADLGEADLREANLSKANLSGANLSGANLSGANLNGANLIRALLCEANLSAAIFRGADLSGAELGGATLVRADFTSATLTGCHVYGVSVWEVNLRNALQTDLVITPNGESAVTVDNLEVAQFTYLLLNNQKLRQVIDTITSKVVLILGRFSEEQKPVLDAIKGALRERNYLPILFDFEGPSTRDVGETVSTLAHLARFVIVDITDPVSVPQELQSIVPNLPSVPIQPLLRKPSGEYGMFEHFQEYPWVLEIRRYRNQGSLIRSLGGIITDLEAKRDDLLKRRQRRRKTPSRLPSPST